MSEKEITLKHNGYEIKVKIKNNFKETKENIKKTLYFRDNDIEKYKLYFIDEEDDQIEVDDEDNIKNFDEGFAKAKIWGLELIDEIEGGKGNANLDEIIEKMKNVKEAMNDQAKAFQRNITNKFKEISDKKISELSQKYENKIKNLEDIIISLKKKNKDLIDIIEKMKEIQDSSIKNILNYAEKKVEEKLDEYNAESEQSLNSKISESKLGINQSSINIRNSLNELSKNQQDIQGKIEDSKEYFKSIYKLSLRNINNPKK
jgi:hypothetical protein